MPHDHSVLLALPNELAIATAISSRPSEYFAQLVLERFALVNAPLSFIRTFVARLLLERPDFEQSSRVGAALLSLYSQYVSATWREGRAGKREREELGRDFDDLGELVRDRIRGSDLLEGFRVVETIEMPDGQKVLRMAKMMERDYVGSRAARDDLRQDLPSMLWIFASLIEDN